MTARARKAAPPAAIEETIQLHAVALDHLYIHALNPRTEPPEAEIEALAGSIAELGLIENLAGYGDPDNLAAGIGIVCGGRRLRAIRALAARGEWAQTVPVTVTDSLERATDWAIVGNIYNPLSAADEIIAYTRLAENGQNAEAIARAFGVRTLHVRQRLRLAHLPAIVIAALKAGEITLDAAMTLAIPDPARAAEIFEAGRARNTLENWWIRDQVTHATVRGADRRAKFVGLAEYEAAGGKISRDLFSEASYLHDEALLDRLFSEKLAAAAAAKRAEGWAEVRQEDGTDYHAIFNTHTQAQTPVRQLPDADAEELERLSEQDELTDEELARQEELEARMIGEWGPEDRASLVALVYVDYSGDLQSIDGLRPKTAAAGSGDSAAGGSVTHEPKLPESVRQDAILIRRAAIQAALLDSPGLTLDLMAYHLIVEERARFSHIAGLKIPAQPVTPSVADGLELPQALTRPNAETDIRTPADAEDFLRLRAAPEWEDTRNRILHEHFVRTFVAVPGALTDTVAALAGADIRRHWTPSAKNWFSRVTAADLVDCFTGIVGDEPDAAEAAKQVRIFAALKKKDMARELDDLFNRTDTREAYGLSRAQNERIDRWLPPMLRSGSQAEG